MTIVFSKSGISEANCFLAKNAKEIITSCHFAICLRDLKDQECTSPSLLPDTKDIKNTGLQVNFQDLHPLMV